MTSLKEKITGIPKKLKSCLAVLVSLIIASTFAYEPNEDKPIHKMTWDSTHYKNEDGTIEAQFPGGWVHYLDADKKWQNIETTLKKNGDFYEMDKAPFTVNVPMLSTGTATFISNNRWDNAQNKEIPDAPLTMSLTAQGVAEVQGKVESGDFGFGETSYIVYPNAYPQIKADLIYWVHKSPVPELKKIIRINEDPKAAQDVKLCFDTGFNKAIDLKEGNVPKEGKIVTEDQINITPDGKDGPRKIILEKAYIWHQWASSYENDVDQIIEYPSDAEEITIEMDGQTLCKILPKSYLESSEYPVYSDATVGFTPSPGTADGYAYWGNLSGELWTTARNSAVTSWNNTDVAMPFGIYSNGAVNEYENFWRAKAIFNTASIDDSAIINSVQISGSMSSAINNFNDKLGITSATTASNTVVASGDFPVANCGVTPFSGGVAMVVGNFTENLNAAGRAHINKTGYTKFCFNSLRDITNDEPTWVANRGGYGYLATSEGAGITLTVNYGPINNAKKILPLM